MYLFFILRSSHDGCRYFDVEAIFPKFKQQTTRWVWNILYEYVALFRLPLYSQHGAPWTFLGNDSLALSMCRRLSELLPADVRTPSRNPVPSFRRPSESNASGQLFLRVGIYDFKGLNGTPRFLKSKEPLWDSLNAPRLTSGNTLRRLSSTRYYSERWTDESIPDACFHITENIGKM